jgi:beta-glucanase (GH16 family)
MSYPRLSKAMFIAALLALAGCSNGNGNSAIGGELANPPPPTSASWELVFEDDFDTGSLNREVWEVQTGDGTAEGIPGWGNNELQYYTEDNISFEDGNLVIEARMGDSPDPNYNYTSARIRSQGGVTAANTGSNGLDFTFGRVEARIQVPPGVGLWAAFWLLGSDPSVYGAWAAKGEIDIMESFGGDTPFLQAAAHYGMEFPQNQLVFKRNDDIDPTDGFHQYAVEWEADQIRWFVDGEHYMTLRKESYWNYFYDGMMNGFQEGGESAPFDENQHIILNMAVGGNLPGFPSDPSVFPARMLVDYVRLYRCPLDPENSGAGCAFDIDEVDPFLISEFPEADVFTASYDLYLDGVQTLFEGTGSDRVLEIDVFDNSGALVVTEVATPEGGTAIDALSSGGGNFSLRDVTLEGFNLFGVGTSEPGSGRYGGEIKFDIEVVSGAGTDPSGLLQVRMDSGFPDVGFVEVPFNSLPADEWTTVSIPISDMLQGNQGAFGGQAPDVANIVNLVTFEPTSSAHFRVANIRLACGAPSACGIQAKATQPLNIYVDAVDERWGRGIVGFDTIVGGDYTDGSAGNHVSWVEVDTGEEGQDTVVEATFDDNGASGVIFIGAPEGEAIDVSSYADGELVFDARFLRNPNNLPLIYKIDGKPGEGTGERSLGVLDLNEWSTFTIPVETLVTQGLVLTDVSAFVLMPSFSGQDAVFQFDNVRFEPTRSGGATEVGVPVDFEIEGAFYNFANFEGGVSGVTSNPDPSGINTSETVAQMQKFSGAPFGGSTLLLDVPVDFSESELMAMKVWSQRPVDVTFKLEAAQAELVASHGGSGWEELFFDFTDRTVDGELGITIIFDNGTVGDAGGDPDSWTFYYDDIVIAGATPPGTGGDGATGCPECTDFDDPDGVYQFADFGDPVPAMTMLAVDPLDPSNTVAMTNKPLGTPEWAGTTLNRGLTVYPLTSSASIITIRVYSPDAGIPVRLKVENSADPGVSVETEAMTTMANAWETLTFDFNNPAPGTAPLNPDAVYDTLSIFFNFGTSGDVAGDKTYLWDTIEFPGGGSPPSGGISYSTDFESADPAGSEIGDGWTTFVNVFDGGGSFLYGYGTFPAPNGTGGISSIETGEGGAEQGTQYLNAFSDYNNGDHAVGNLINVLVFQERQITAGDGGNYRFRFDAKAPSSGGIAAPSTATAFIKTIDPASGFATTTEVTLDMSSVSSTDWETFTLDLAIDAEALEGQLLQFGFTNTATNFDPSGIYYDNVDFGIFVPPTSISYSTDFEAADPAGAEIGDGWTTFINVFDGGGGFLYGYGTFPAPNGTGAISSIESGEAGAAQGTQYLNAFSDYNNPDHASGNLINVLIFQERSIQATDGGTYRLSFDAKAPSSDGIAPPSTATAFIKTLDPASGFATTTEVTIDMSSVSNSEWVTFSVDLELDAEALQGQLIQFGFTNTATNYDPSGIYYDNVDFGLAP